MKTSTTLAALIAAILAGSVYAYVAVYRPAAERLDRPTDGEATTAWRRVRNEVSGKPAFPNVTVRLETCNPAPQVAGVTCFGEIDWGEGAPEKRPMQFVRFKGEWIRPGE